MARSGREVGEMMLIVRRDHYSFVVTLFSLYFIIAKRKLNMEAKKEGMKEEIEEEKGTKGIEKVKMKEGRGKGQEMTNKVGCKVGKRREEKKG